MVGYYSGYARNAKTELAFIEACISSSAPTAPSVSIFALTSEGSITRNVSNN